MQCKKCGGEKFIVYKCNRNKKWDAVKKEWINDLNADTRETICSECGTRYITVTLMQFAIVFDDDALKPKRVTIEKFKTTMEREINRRQGNLFNN